MLRLWFGVKSREVIRSDAMKLDTILLGRECQDIKELKRMMKDKRFKAKKGKSFARNLKIADEEYQAEMASRQMALGL